MVSCDQFHRSAPRLCRNDGLEDRRAEMLAAFDKRLENLKGCVHWLIAQGVAVVNVDFKRNQDSPHLQVAGGSFLKVLFKDDCACMRREPEGHLVRETWVARRFDTVIWWEEVICD